MFLLNLLFPNSYEVIAVIKSKKSADPPRYSTLETSRLTLYKY